MQRMIQLNLRYTGRAVLAGLAVAAALTMTACSSNDDSSTTHHASSAAATTTAPQAPLPSVAQLNAEVQKALDPSTPLAEKNSYFQGVTADPELATKLQKQYAASNIKIQVIGVDGRGGDNAMATAQLTVNGKQQDQPAQVAIVYEDGKWKIAKAFVCQGLSMAGESSAACPSAPTS